MPIFNLVNLERRVVSALIIIPFVLWAIYYGGLAFASLVGFCAAVVLYEWWVLSSKTRHPLAFMALGVSYVFLAFGACYLIRTEMGVAHAVLFVLMVWASDTGAFFAGKLIGGPKMAPKISPNKTIAGLVAAVGFPALIALLYALLRGSSISSYFIFLLLGAVLGFVGQIGDLFISMLKRLVGVKDTGDIIPGHGGLLDRVDALMLAAPVYYALMNLHDGF